MYHPVSRWCNCLFGKDSFVNDSDDVHIPEIASSRLGFWAALCTGVLNFAYFIPFLLYQPILHAEWKGLAAHAASFDPAPFVAWVVPCMLLPVAFVIMICCLYFQAGTRKRIYGLLALIFAVMYAAVLVPAYYIQLTVVQHNLVAGNTEGLALWLYANPYPYSIPGALEGVGYGFMCVSFLFASLVFERHGLGRWLFLIFLGNAICGSVVFTDLIAPLPHSVVMVDLVIEGVLLAAAPFLMAVYFHRRRAFA